MKGEWGDVKGRGLMHDVRRGAGGWKGMKAARTPDSVTAECRYLTLSLSLT